jgi:RNA polymerase sigma factor (sigma-70 family)
MAGQVETRFERIAGEIRAGGEPARRAMDELVRAETAHLARTIWQKYPQLRGEVQDIVAETFEAVWRRAKKCGCFRPGGTYSAFRALASRQASFLAQSRLRRASERSAKAEMVSTEGLAAVHAAVPFEPADTSDAEAQIIGALYARQILERVDAALAHLTERQRIVARLLLTRPPGEVNRAICDALHVSDGAAREAKRAVRERLRLLVPL